MKNPSRRQFLSSVASLSAAKGGVEALPWEREMPLREAAEGVFLESVLHPRCPQPDAAWPRGPAMLVSNPAIKASVWGPADRVTISLLKTDVFDRRVGWVRPVTLKEIRAGAFSPANKGYDDQPPGRRRPGAGILVPEGGRREPYSYWAAYPFPCQKPVGQIIVGIDALRGAEQPRLRQSCRTGLIEFRIAKGAAGARMEFLLSMTRNVIAVQGSWSGIAAPVTLRLYRHRDQSHRYYMDTDGKSFLRRSVKDTAPGSRERAIAEYDYLRDAAWNGPLDPPESGREGRYFWIRQRMPAEKTFPEGFTYVLMGLVVGDAEIAIANGQTGLGTPPHIVGDTHGPDPYGTDVYMERWYGAIREAPGSAATARIDAARLLQAYVAVVTPLDAPDIMVEAKRRLEEAERAGLGGLVEENAAWYGDLYTRRENGRVFCGQGGRQVTEDIRDLYRSWYCTHGGTCKTDARKYQASAHYAVPEQDWQNWHGIPCYNELFYTPAMVRNRADSVDMWWQFVSHWLPAARRNAREVFEMPGMCLVHGYLPPIKPDRYVHTNSQLELCLDTAAQVLKVLWDEWDYGGDEAFLREKVYPALRDLAVFYAAYAQKLEDGYYHVIPAVEAEAWGIYPEFARSKDTISALCMFRWTFLRAAEAAAHLGVDPGLRVKWLAMASRMAPYPRYEDASGTVFNALPGVKPGWKYGDHPWYIGVYPTTLADEITLDSDRRTKEMMMRTARSAPATPSSEVFVLLGACPDTTASMVEAQVRPIQDLETLRAEVNRHPERLINSRSGRIHLFPCVPGWAAIGFRRFQARGGFLISAVNEKDGVSFVEIEARRDRLCCVMNPWPGSGLIVTEQVTGKRIPANLDKTNGECFTFAARAGGRYRLSRA